MKVEIGYQSYVIQCLNCAYWDHESGLTARKCNKHKFITKQYDFCSFAKGVNEDNEDNERKENNVHPQRRI